MVRTAFKVHGRYLWPPFEQEPPAIGTDGQSLAVPGTVELGFDGAEPFMRWTPWGSAAVLPTDASPNVAALSNADKQEIRDSAGLRPWALWLGKIATGKPPAGPANARKPCAEQRAVHAVF